MSKYFASFEKLMKQVECPFDHWTLLLQSVLVGKALEVYSCLGDSDSSSYEVVKEAILNAYKLVPEAYRIKFRNYKKDSNLTYMEFARTKEQYFNDWCTSMGVDNLDQLRELILMEDFKVNIPPEIKLYIEENQVSKMSRAAELADEYYLTHHFNPSAKFKDRKTSSTGAFQKQNKDWKLSEDKTDRKVSKNDKELKCYFCDKKGHRIKNCFKHKAHLENAKKTVGLISGIDSSMGPKGNNHWLETIKHFGEHLVNGSLALNEGGASKPITALRDTGAAVSLVLKSSLPAGCNLDVGEYVMVGGFPDSCTPCPMLSVYLETELVKGNVRVAVADKLPVSGVDLLLGNDLVNRRMPDNPILLKELVPEIEVAVTTRSGLHTDSEGDFDFNLEHSNVDLSAGNRDFSRLSLRREDLIIAQREDEDLKVLFTQCSDEAVDDLCKEQFVLRNDVLHRLSRPITASSHEILDQIVVPCSLREKVISLAHENMMSGHLGVNKTFKKVSNYFYWPSMRREVKKYVNSCHECQMTGKPNKPVPKAPLINIPIVSEPFSEIVIDMVGPLPKSKRGNSFILTIMDRMSRYPEAIPVRNAKARNVVHHLIQYFTRFGLPKRIQSDRGSNFTGTYFKDQMKQLNINHVTSTPYHPESQGIVERFHQTLKSILRKMCDSNDRVWDDMLPFALFAIRSAPSETLGLSPFELIFGHRVRGPVEVLREAWEDVRENVDVVDRLDELRTNLYKAWEVAKENEMQSQKRSKSKHDRKAISRNFGIGDFVLALLPKEGSSLQYKFSGPFKILDKRGDVNYLIESGNKKKPKWLHVNLLKKYNLRCSSLGSVNVNVVSQEPENLGESIPMSNSQVLADFDKTVSSLNPNQTNQVKSLLLRYPNVTSDNPGLTNLMQHDVELTDETPIRQHPYRLNPLKAEIVKREVDYMIRNRLAVPSSSPWASPVVLVKKDDGQYRLCIDYRKVNAVTKPDNFPLPRVIDCLDKIGKAQYISKIDLLKGYWQVPLTSRARKVSAFVTPSGSFECLVMPFGMHNAASTFQRLMCQLLNNIEGCVVYLDDLVIYSNTWEQHLIILNKVLEALSNANLVLNLRKCEFCKAQITYLGHQIGLGMICPKESNVKTIINFPMPQNKKQAMRFIGMVGYFRRFVPNFSDIAAPITSLFKKTTTFNFDDNCIKAFNKLKSVMTNKPILVTPDFALPFKLAVDASDLGAGSVLFQTINNQDHPVSYFSKKFDKHQVNYSTIEKELLSLLLALQHFDVYVCNSLTPVTVFTDHNPLVFLSKFRNKNKRLTRWSIELQDYNLDIKHVKGSDNKIADALSRGFPDG